MTVKPKVAQCLRLLMDDEHVMLEASCYDQARCWFETRSRCSGMTSSPTVSEALLNYGKNDMTSDLGLKDFGLCMFKNYLKIAVRNLLKYKGYSVINIGGLAIGIACCLLIALWVVHELSYDRFHSNAGRIYRVAEIFRDDGKIVEESAGIPFPVGPTLREAFPNLKTARFYQTFEKVPLLRHGENSFYEPRLFFTDSTVFDIFSFELVQGNPKTALTAPFSIVLTESSARKYFGNENPLGKILRFENQLDFTVTGVVRDVPATSHVQFDFLASLLNLGDIFRASGTTFSWRGWYWNPCHTYILLPPEYSREQFETLLPGFVQKHADERMRANLSFYLQPLTDIHLHSNLYQELGVNGNERSVYLFAIIAVFILLLACINFMNLATARSIKRAKEIAVRKVVGAFRTQLVGQFLGESLLISFIAAFLAIIVVELLLPTFARISGANLNLALIGFPQLLAGVGLLAVVVGLIAGSYPALFLSSYLPVEGLGLKSNRGAGAITALFRKGLVVFQYKKEERLSLVLSSFSMLAIVIACLGLFGLAAFATEQRTKEIGPAFPFIILKEGRGKVLGASVTNLVALLSKDFAKHVLIANVIAWPLAWFAMSKWLEDFPYRIAMSPRFLIFASLAAIAILTVSYQALRAALANPVEALRYE